MKNSKNFTIKTNVRENQLPIFTEKWFKKDCPRRKRTITSSIKHQNAGPLVMVV